jgi:crossover junction endodeoxyribonuclease RuvC
VTLGVLDMQKLDDQPIKLKTIFERTLSLIDEYKPDEVSLEAPFFGKNVQSMLKLGRAQGVAIAAALYRNIPIFEYSPKKIKMSITGNGNASKEQVASMLKSLLLIKEMPKYLDATDGLAAAMCHYFQNGKPEGGKTFSGWKAFLGENPQRKL